MLLNFVGANTTPVPLGDIKVGQTIIYDGMLFIVTDEPESDIPLDVMCIRLSTGESLTLSVEDKVIAVDTELNILSADSDLFYRENI
nr:MAG TPA: translation initiation factor-like protein [Caudoviricetes sp.]